MRHSKSKLLGRSDVNDNEDSQEWIMSYADTVTLLLCFFILFFAERTKDYEDEILLQISKQVQKPKTQDSAKDQGGAERARQKAKMLSQLEAQLRQKLNQFEVKKVKLGIERRRKEILLRLYEKDFFHVGSWNLKTQGKGVLKEVADLLVPFEGKVLIRVEGHSDSLGVNPFSAYKNNLNLSSLRASQAANVLISNKIKEEQLRVVGVGSASKLVEDRGPANEYVPKLGVKNRRIEIRIQVEKPEIDKVIELNFQEESK